MRDGLRPRGDLRSLAAVFAPLGWRAIGGPAVHVALMEREVVRRRHWLEREEFARLFAACNLLPGPGSTQLALLIGLRRAGCRGMLLVALFFIGPAVLIMLALAELYVRFGADRHAQLVLLGVDAAVVGIVARAAVDLSVLGRRGPTGALIAVAALAGGIVGVNPLLVLVGGGVIAYLAWITARPGGGGHSRNGMVATAFPWIATIPSAAAGGWLVPSPSVSHGQRRCRAGAPSPQSA